MSCSAFCLTTLDRHTALAYLKPHSRNVLLEVLVIGVDHLYSTHSVCKVAKAKAIGHGNPQLFRCSSHSVAGGAYVQTGLVAISTHPSLVCGPSQKTIACFAFFTNDRQPWARDGTRNCILSHGRVSHHPKVFPPTKRKLAQGKRNQHLLKLP